jgi:3-deoxy-D-manno-octulosonic-acid transferase
MILSKPLYTLGVACYVAAIYLASFFNPKARLWVRGRKNIFKRLREKMGNNTFPVVWIHCASYGEFEQGRPLIERIFKEKKYFVLVTFFSPSGKEAFKFFEMAHYVEYLPPDFPGHVRKFLSIVKPNKALFIRYEFWLNYLFELKKRNISHYLISAIFKPHHPFFRWYGSVFRESLKGFSEIFVQDNTSLTLLNGIGIENASIQGDSRIDRVIKIKNDPAPVEGLYLWKNTKGPVVCFGSIWENDMDWIIRWWAKWKTDFPELKGLLIPHEISNNMMDYITTSLKENKFSFAFFGQPVENEDFLIVNKMGYLSKIYRHADVAYVGGAMGNGVHNILEPAVYEIPVIICGNNLSNFIEIEELIKESCVFHILPEGHAQDIIKNVLTNKTIIKEKLNKYFTLKAGASDKMFEKIFQNRGFEV